MPSGSLPPFRAWVESEIQGHLPRMLCFVLAQAILVFLLCVAGGGAVYRRAERWLRGRVPEEDLVQKRAPSVYRPLSKIQKKANQIRYGYMGVVGLALWAWFWFISPVREWYAQGPAEAMPKVLGLCLVWMVLSILVAGVGGKFVYRLAERALRRRTEARGEDPDAPVG